MSNTDSTHVHAIKVSYLGPTDYRGSRVKLTSWRFHDSVTLSYDYEIGSPMRQAVAWLSDHGYSEISTAEAPDFYVVTVHEFSPLKEAVTV